MAYIQSHKEQIWLLPPSLEDLIPEDHICYLVESLVETLNYESFDVRYSGAGHPAYHPRILLKLLIMGVLDRVRSSRRLARSARENVVYMYLSEKTTPDFRTISDFRKDNPELIKEVFQHTVGFAKKEGLLDLSHLATDGSKVKANASNKRVLTKEELAVLHGFVQEELEEWAKQDTVEEEVYGEMRGIDQLPKQSRKAVQKAARYYMKQVKEQGADFKQKIEDTLTRAQSEIDREGISKVSTTDTGSRFMKNKKGKIELSYNAQVTADKAGFVIANNISQNAADVDQLKPQVLQTKENLGELPVRTVWSFDAGYFEGDNISFLAEENIDGYIPDNNEGKENSPFDKKNFVYSAEEDKYTCPAEDKMVFIGAQFDKQKGKTIRVYKGQSCFKCQMQHDCTKRKGGIRYLKMFPHEGARNNMSAKMKTVQARKTYKLRQQIVEPVIGDIKENKGVRSFLTRGIKTVKTEFNIICAAINIKRIWLFLQEKDKEGQNMLFKLA